MTKFDKTFAVLRREFLQAYVAPAQHQEAAAALGKLVMAAVSEAVSEEIQS